MKYFQYIMKYRKLPLKTYFIAIDGDDVGRKLEYFTIKNDMDSLEAFSKKFEKGMVWLISKLQELLSARIIFTGGDNLLAEFERGDFINIISLIKEEFYNITLSTLSIGIGLSPREAYFSLKISKSSGKNTITIYQEV